jgi:quaternary ammonium compound-resistance protein SugE
MTAALDAASRCGVAWAWIGIAGLLEIGWAIGLKYLDGTNRPWLAAGTGLAMLASFGCLAQGLKQIPLGTGYAVWTGIGAVGTAVLGIVLFAESADWPRLACIGLIVGGIVGLKLTSTA